MPPAGSAPAASSPSPAAPAKKKKKKAKASKERNGSPLRSPSRGKKSIRAIAIEPDFVEGANVSMAFVHRLPPEPPPSAPEMTEKEWIAEQERLSRMMQRMYSGNYGGEEGDYADDEDYYVDGEEDEDEDELESLEAGSVTPSGSGGMPSSHRATISPTLPPPTTTAAAAPSDEESSMAAQLAESSDGGETLEPFGIGRQAIGFEPIELKLSQPPKIIADMPPPPKGEPPLTPRSLASSIAARRQANQKTRSEASARASSSLAAAAGSIADLG